MAVRDPATLYLNALMHTEQMDEQNLHNVEFINDRLIHLLHDLKAKVNIEDILTMNIDITESLLEYRETFKRLKDELLNAVEILINKSDDEGLTIDND